MSAHLKLLIDMMQADSEPLNIYEGTICLLMYTVALRAPPDELFISYIEEDKMGGMAANIFISAATGL